MTILTTNWSGALNISLALLLVFFSQFIVCVITDTFRITLPILVYTDKLLQFVVHILALVMSQQPIKWSCNWTTPLTRPCDCLLLNLINWPLSLLPNSMMNLIGKEKCGLGVF